MCWSGIRRVVVSGRDLMRLMAREDNDGSSRQRGSAQTTLSWQTKAADDHLVVNQSASPIIGMSAGAAVRLGDG